MIRKAFGAVALLGLAGVASAQSAGDILFIGNGVNRTNGVLDDAIGWIPGAGGAATNLLTSNAMGTSFNAVTRGPGGNYYFTANNRNGSGTFDASTGELFTVDGLFSGFGTKNVFGGGNLANAPLDLVYNQASSSFFVVNNPSGTGLIDNPEDGITSVTLGNAQQQLFQEPDIAMPAPRWDAGTDIVADPFRPNSFYVLTLNEGVDGGGGDGAASLLFRMNVSPDLGTVTMDLLQDFSASVTGLSDTIQFATGVNVDPVTGDVMVSAAFEDRGVYRVGIDAMGNSTGVSQFADMTALQMMAGVESGGVNEIEWDPFGNRWLFAESTAGDFDRITALNPDGTGYEVLVSGIAVTDLIVIPTPGAASLLALAGLGVLRRRR